MMDTRVRQVVATLLAGTLSATAPVALAAEPLRAAAESASALTWVRLEGADRYGTMQAISERAFSSSDWAIIASGADFPDALASSAIAGALDCPVLITERDRLSTATAAELSRLGVTSAFVVGGTSSVSDEVLDTVAASGITVERLAGSSRQETSLVVAQKIRELQQAGTVTKRPRSLIVATGGSFADALSVSPYAYASASPILLAGAGGMLTASQVEALEDDPFFDEIVLVGGEASVSGEVAAQVSGAHATSVRLGGADRYETSCLVADWEQGKGFSWSTPVVAAGKNFPDALCGAALAGGTDSVMLLVDNPSNATWSRLDEHATEAFFGYVLGGMSSTPLDKGAPSPDPTDPTGTTEGVSPDAHLNEILETLVTTVTGTDEGALAAAYEYIASYPYISGDTYPAGEWQDWSVPYAIEMYEQGGGNCYRYASLMAWCARRLGYEAVVVSGKTYSSTGEIVPHGWCEVTLDGQAYVIDCERHRFMPDIDLFMVTYDQARIYYLNLADELYV